MGRAELQKIEALQFLAEKTSAASFLLKATSRLLHCNYLSSAVKLAS